ncbi:hypothetical protein [Streptomyces sp. NPDC058268]|uniref:hypothetical protein n=1 Tax=Streptomyces sp. NPDC058268 TaxID=3346413 RepID=UPI0036E5F444
MINPLVGQAARPTAVAAAWTRIRPAVAVAVLAVTVSACIGSTDHAKPSKPAKVTGLRDDIRSVAQKTTTATRPRMVEKCTPSTKRVKHSSTTGTGRNKRTRTWYTNEKYNDCKKVQQGTEKYTKVLRRARWCVELDDLNGKRSKDDVWFEVDAATYNSAAAKKEGSKLSFAPLRNGC